MSTSDLEVKASEASQDLLQRRTSGILLHPSSLPGPHGIGDLGPWAHRFLDFTRGCGCCLWQMLPLGPTGFGGSPYQCTSAFAGNPLLISLERLIEWGLVAHQEVEEQRIPPQDHVDFEAALAAKTMLLQRAFDRFRAHQDSGLLQAFNDFVEAHGWWLEDFVLYAALKEEHHGHPWFRWSPELRRRDSAAMNLARGRLGDRLDYLRFAQFIFFRQWHALKEQAAARGIFIVGDIPIFPAHDSADVWANPSIFKLDEAGMPHYVAGVPPDYFSKDGQLWGNPVYRWDVLASQGYAWWIQRFQHVLNMVDIVRLDHFRGFVAAWEIPAEERTAVNGQWVPGPGKALFETLRQKLGRLPLLAEDLGFMTPEVEELRTSLELPGMKILQFAFDSDAKNPYLPHNFTRDFVVYTGTHDNDTTRGFLDAAPAHTIERIKSYLGQDHLDIPWDIIRIAYGSVARTAVVPMQDILELGTEARLNFPGKEEGNWRWRFLPDQLDETKAQRLRALARLYGREA